MSDIRPISFAIASCKIVSHVPDKTQLVSVIDPTATVPGRRNYNFTKEADYYAEYQKSWFAHTCKKAGWDCMRHYEIIANGCLPLFRGLEACPADALTVFPKDLCMRAIDLYRRTMADFNADAEQEATSLIREFLDYARAHLTTEALAQRILDEWDVKDGEKVLFIGPNLYPDYQRDLLLDGMKRLKGKDCVEVANIPFMYSDFTGDITRLYGRGMSYSRNLDPSLRNVQPIDKIMQDVRDARFQLIIYGSCHRSMLNFREICLHGQGAYCMVVCGEDSDEHHICDPNWFRARKAEFYQREKPSRPFVTEDPKRPFPTLKCNSSTPQLLALSKLPQST